MSEITRLVLVSSAVFVPSVKNKRRCAYLPLRRTNDARCALLVQLISRFKELAVQIKELQTVLFVLWQDLRVVHYLCCVSIISSSIVTTRISASSFTKIPTIGRLSFDDLFF